MESVKEHPGELSLPEGLTIIIGKCKEASLSSTALETLARTHACVPSVCLTETLFTLEVRGCTSSNGPC